MAVPLLLELVTKRTLQSEGKGEVFENESILFFDKKHVNMHHLFRHVRQSVSIQFAMHDGVVNARKCFDTVLFTFLLRLSRTHEA